MWTKKIVILIALYLCAYASLFMAGCDAHRKGNKRSEVQIHEEVEREREEEEVKAKRAPPFFSADRRRRKLQENTGTTPNDIGAEISDLMFKKDSKRSIQKEERLRKFTDQLKDVPSPVYFKPEPWCQPHNAQKNAIFATAIGTFLIDATIFLKTLRAVNIEDDLVIAMDIQSYAIKGMQELLETSKAIVYVVNFECTHDFTVGNDTLIANIDELTHYSLCKYLDYYESNKKIWDRSKIPSSAKPGLKMVGRFSVNVMRYHFNFWWTRLYSDSSKIMITDFRDVLFQSNPFNPFKKNVFFKWPQTNFLMIFKEAFPNIMIYRCGFNSGWIRACFGENALQKVAQNLVSCSGVSIGSKNAMYAYNFLMIHLLNPKNRYGKSLLGAAKVTIDYALFTQDSDVDIAENQMYPGNKACLSIGIDQGFHNYLVYSGVLDKLLTVKHYPQGEGPVNTLGKFYNGGKNTILAFNLTDWNILKGKPGEKKFYNWNGEISPVVHQVIFTNILDLYTKYYFYYSEISIFV